MIPKYYELLAAKSTLLDLKMFVIAAQIQSILRKYRPDQPRVPAGQPTGGQWTDDAAVGERIQDAAVGERIPDAAIGERIHVAGRYDPARSEICDAQLLLDEELCRMAKSARCWSLSMDRHAACMKNNFIPKLRF